MHFNAAVALSLKAFWANDYYNFQNKPCQTFRPVCGRWVRQQYSSYPISLPFSLWIFISHFSLFLFISFPCLRRQISSPICIRSRGLSGVSAGTYLMGDTVGTFPHILNIDDRPGYLHADLPPRCSPLGSPRQRLGLFKCQFIFFPIIANVLPPLSEGKSLL